MKNPNRLGDLTVTDLLRLHRIMRRLDALDDAIAATSLQAKPAIRHLLREAYSEAANIFDRGARAFGKHVQGGWVPGVDLDEEFWAHARSVCEASAQAAQEPENANLEAGGAAPAELAGEAGDPNRAGETSNQN